MDAAPVTNLSVNVEQKPCSVDVETLSRMETILKERAAAAAN